LFYRALSETGCVAVGELVMYGREYAVVVRPGSRGLVLHTLFYENEVRVQEEAPADLGLVDEKELELAKMLVNAERGTFDPAKLKDKFKKRVLEVIENRAATAVPGSASNQERKAAPVVDIMDAGEERDSRARGGEEGQAAGEVARSTPFATSPPGAGL
jgi:DNA end-binding protein Ku